MWRIVMLLVATAVGVSALSPRGITPSDRARRLAGIPQTVLWAWERPEDLREIASGEAIAFLAQTITIRDGAPITELRRQPLRVPDATTLVAVTRLESPRPKQLALNEGQTAVIVDAIVRSSQLRRVVAVQIDFDATESQRALYLALLHATRAALDETVPMSITALASWCVGDRWLQSAPVDEVVPMLFRMGPLSDGVKVAARSTALLDPRCTGAVGISLDEPLRIVRHDRRVYAFSPRAWTRADVDRVRRIDQ